MKTRFGLDPKAIALLGWDLAVERILHDVQSDFVYAPHLRYIYRFAQKDLIDAVKGDLSRGAFSPGLPLHIEVPKSSRMRTKNLSRFGPAFSRQGSILLPKDRLLYQLIADAAAPTIKVNTDASRSFSHQLAPKDSPLMFLPTRKCWSKFQKALAQRSKKKGNGYVMRTDIANCFAAINQHILVNKLRDGGLSADLTDRLETMLTAFTGERSSRGILQGMFPSDLLGNFYLNPIDRFLKDRGVDSARYVDDVYIFVSSAQAADSVMRELISTLREYGLSLNESKSVLMRSGHLITEEADLEVLFQDAVDEIAEQLVDEDRGVDYGFQTDWEDEAEQDEDDLELQATMKLFDSIGDYKNQEENIERFCLPLFTKAESDYAVGHVLENFRKRPAMVQIYCAYLVKFVEKQNVVEFLSGIVDDEAMNDWQVMWIAAALLRLKKAGDDLVKPMLDIYKDANRHDALRAAAAIFIGRFGDHDRRKSLMDSYGKISSPYIQSAIYFSSFSFTKAQRINAKSMWSQHGELNRLLSAAAENRS